MGAANILTNGGKKMGINSSSVEEREKNGVCSLAGKMELGVGDDIGKRLEPALVPTVACGLLQPFSPGSLYESGLELSYDPGLEAVGLVADEPGLEPHSSPGFKYIRG